MTNQYVPDLTQLGAGDIARSADVNDRYENTVAGFDRLPVPKNGEQGFSAPVPVGTPVNADHAVTKNWAETAMSSQLALAEAEAIDAANSAAAALSSQNQAASSASSASTSAGTATTKAAEALASEGVATTKAGEASTSAANALASEQAADADRILAQTARTAAEAAYDSFDDRYLGPQAADPTLDNDGNALLTGALYFDTNSNNMKVYSGSQWLAAYIPPSNLTLQEVTNNGASTSQAVTFTGSVTASNASINLTNIGTTTSTTDAFMTLTAAGLVEKRTLGSLAFSSATFDNYQGWQLNGGTSTEAIGKNETVTFTGAGGTTVSNSGNTVTITSTDTNTTNFNVQANSGTAENISAGETINFTGSGGVSVTRAGNSFTIDGSSAGITDVVSDTTPQLGGQLDANGNTILMGINTITDAKVGQWDVAYGDKVNTVAFDTGTGILTLNRQDGGTVTKDLDGRYPLNNGTGATGTWAISISGNAATATSASSAPFNGLTGKTSGTGTYTTSGAFNAPLITTDKINARSTTQLVLNAGESDTYDSGQTGEAIYLNAENGVQVVSSPDNWVSGWAGRKTAVINDSSGNSSFPGNISVTGTVDGRDVAADGTKLDGIAAGAQVNVGTNLGQSRTGSSFTVTSSTGSNVNLPAATTTLWGVMTDEDKTKLDGIAAGATNTAAPAITSNGSTPSLASGITAAEVRSLIGAGTSSTTGTVTSVTGGNGLTGSVTTSGSLAVGAGAGMHVNANDVALYSSVTAGGSTTLADEAFRTVTSAGQTITLPASPAAGDTVYISNGNSTNTTVARNGSNISGLAENMIIDVANIGITLVYSGNATQGWRLM